MIALAAAYDAHRAELVRLARRMTGALAEAEDLVQEAYVRLQRTEPAPDNARAWLYRVVTRLCLDHLKSARVQREVYPGPWLPEPVAEPVSTFADTAVELADEVSLALQLALERLSPGERAAFVLRDVFDVDYAEIAAALERSEAACRQLVTRARAHVRESRPTARPPTPDEAQRVFQTFMVAVASGDLRVLTSVLADDALMMTDGGGKASAAGRPVVGAALIARFFVGVMKKYPPPDGVRYVPARISGMPGMLVFDGDVCVQTLALDIRDGVVVGIYAVRNPDKLGHLSAKAGRTASSAGGTPETTQSS